MSVGVRTLHLNPARGHSVDERIEPHGADRTLTTQGLVAVFAEEQDEKSFSGNVELRADGLHLLRAEENVGRIERRGEAFC